MAEISLRGRVAAGRVAVVDDADLPLVSGRGWSALRESNGQFYARSTDRAHVLMHNLIMGVHGIDHRDRDGLNNRRANLRVASRGQNAANMRKPQRRRRASSLFKGVTLDPAGRGWEAQLRVDRRNHNLGYYADEADAASAYDWAARHAFGEYARLNFPYSGGA